MFYARKFAMLVGAVFSFVGCSNYTKAPVCNDGNATRLPGVSGTYTLSVQDEEFNVHTQVVRIVDGGSQVSLKLASGENEEGKLCHINGWNVVESYDDAAQGYSQMRVNISNVGLSFAGIQFDRQGLTASGIPSEISEIERPEELFKKFAPKMFSEVERALSIDNSNVSSMELFKHAKVSPLVVEMTRQ